MSHPTRSRSKRGLFGPEFGIEHVGPREKFGFGRGWHEAGHADSRIVEFRMQGKRKRIEKRFRAVVDRLERARYEARNRSHNQYVKISIAGRSEGSKGKTSTR
jgi:hypothetical protein